MEFRLLASYILKCFAMQMNAHTAFVKIVLLEYIKQVSLIHYSKQYRVVWLVRIQ